MNAICDTLAFPFRLPILSAMPSRVSIARGFLFALKSAVWYLVHQSPRNGKLLATWTLKRCKDCSHRSSEKPGRMAAGVSCVGRQALSCRDVADMPRRLSGGLALDRQCLTSTCTGQAPDKTWQRRPATKWAMHREVCRASIRWATQTKDLRFGFFRRVKFSHSLPFAHKDGENREHPNGQPEAWPDMVVVRSARVALHSFGWLSHFCGGVA